MIRFGVNVSEFTEGRPDGTGFDCAGAAGGVVGGAVGGDTGGVVAALGAVVDAEAVGVVAGFPVIVIVLFGLVFLNVAADDCVVWGVAALPLPVEGGVIWPERSSDE